MAQDDRPYRYAVIEPGAYDCVWTIDGQDFSGTVELRAGRPPTADVRWSIARPMPVEGRPDEWRTAYPQSRKIDRIDGVVVERSIHVSLFDVDAST